MHSWFFFFQAEDGIRDYKVTGVQTCALPISFLPGSWPVRPASGPPRVAALRSALRRSGVADALEPTALQGDRKSTRLNSSHLVISYAVFCLKKKKNRNYNHHKH